MKYICFGYIEPSRFESMSETERNAMLDEAFEYNEHLRANGIWVAGESIGPPETAATVSWKNGKAATTDGPYAETKEQIGGIMIIEARDMNHAIQIMSQNPPLKYGASFEIRPADDFTQLERESQQRRHAAQSKITS